jgi:hypothetical protein
MGEHTWNKKGIELKVALSRNLARLLYAMAKADRIRVDELVEAVLFHGAEYFGQDGRKLIAKLCALAGISLQPVSGLALQAAHPCPPYRALPEHRESGAPAMEGDKFRPEGQRAESRVVLPLRIQPHVFGMLCALSAAYSVSPSGIVADAIAASLAGREAFFQPTLQRSAEVARECGVRRPWRAKGHTTERLP